MPTPYELRMQIPSGTDTAEVITKIADVLIAVERKFSPHPLKVLKFTITVELPDGQDIPFLSGK